MAKPDPKPPVDPRTGGPVPEEHSCVDCGCFAPLRICAGCHEKRLIERERGERQMTACAPERGKGPGKR